jgi:hypothetical protein
LAVRNAECSDPLLIISTDDGPTHGEMVDPGTGGPTNDEMVDPGTGGPTDVEMGDLGTGTSTVDQAINLYANQSSLLLS